MGKSFGFAQNVFWFEHRVLHTIVVIKKINHTNAFNCENMKKSPIS